MKLLTTCIFLVVSLVMMSSSFAQDNEELIAAIERQTEAIKEQTKAMKVIAAIEKRDRSGEISWLLQLSDINEAIDYLKANQ